MASSFAPAKNRFAAHDLIVGVIAGLGVGVFAGMFFAARVSDGPIGVAVGAILGAALGVLALRASHRNSDRLLNPVVVMAWILGAVGWLMVIGVIMAINNLS